MVKIWPNIAASMILPDDPDKPVEVETEMVELRFDGNSRVHGYSERANIYVYWEVLTDEDRERYGLFPYSEQVKQP